LVTGQFLFALQAYFGAVESATALLLKKLQQETQAGVFSESPRLLITSPQTLHCTEQDGSILVAIEGVKDSRTKAEWLLPSPMFTLFAIE
jgi:phage tail sheath protein FI